MKTIEKLRKTLIGHAQRHLELNQFDCSDSDWKLMFSIFV